VPSLKKQSDKSISLLDRAVPWILVIGGAIGIAMAGILTFEHNQILKNPNYIPSCNLNPVVACGSVIASKQAQAFNIPNPWIGLAAFAVLLTTGMAILAGAKLKRWYWVGLELGTIFGLLFVHWLFFETVYRIHALCPYCIVVWVVTITTFWYITIYNFKNGYLRLPKSFSPIGKFISRHQLDILILWFLIIFLLILNHFWYYYGPHFFI
jgi:uncharacterized membrane protein